MSAALVLAVWGLLAAGVAGLELAAHRRRDRVPALADLLDWLTRSSPGRWFLLLAWAWLGWHVFVR